MTLSPACTENGRESRHKNVITIAGILTGLNIMLSFDTSKIFTDARKAFIIKKGEDGTPVSEACRNAASYPRPLS
jgi:hypothetical protein